MAFVYFERSNKKITQLFGILIKHVHCSFIKLLKLHKIITSRPGQGGWRIFKFNVITSSIRQVPKFIAFDLKVCTNLETLEFLQRI